MTSYTFLTTGSLTELFSLFPQFTFFNNFAVLFHIAFFKQDVPLLRKVTAELWFQ